MIKAMPILAVDMATANTVKVVAALPPGSMSLGTVTAKSCQRYHWDAEPTEQTALVALQLTAAQQGANGLAGVTYQRWNVDFGANCYTTITATGTAFKTAN